LEVAKLGSGPSSSMSSMDDDTFGLEVAELGGGPSSSMSSMEDDTFGLEVAELGGGFFSITPVLYSVFDFCR
jgi:hypothetical protein